MQSRFQPVKNSCATQRASFEFQYPVASSRELKIMGDEDRRQVTPAAEIGEKVENQLAGALVQIAGRLVGEQQRGVAGEGARDGDALLLSSGKFSGAMFGAVGQPDFFEARPLRRR